MSINLSDEILMQVEKPTRYTGGEWNSVVKNPKEVDIRVAFCFPDSYEIGMSHLGMKILYHLLNERKDTYCERVFSPWVDMEQKMRENNIPLFALETKDPITEFDFFAFTLLYEMCYTNVINALDLAKIPLLSSQRDQNCPLIIAGGPCTYNPEPLADIIDFFIIGEGEEIINEIMDLYAKHKKSEYQKDVFLKEVSKISGIYVPKFYSVDYQQDGTIKSFAPIGDAPSKIKKRIIKDMDNLYYPDKIIVPFNQIVHDRIMLELFRGCIRGCRFCQAGFVYRPVREKSTEHLTKLAQKLIESTGYEEISLTSLSTSDYSNFMELADRLIELTKDKKINLSLPSLRIDSLSLALLEQVQKVRKSGITLAPEAGSQRLRDVINKGITEENILDSLSLSFKSGWNSVKLYFMVGLPTEDYEDLDAIADLAYKIIDKYYEIPKPERPKGLNITISASNFVPKAFTPFQWEGQDTMTSLHEKHLYLKNKLKHKNISFNWHDEKTSYLEAIFAKGNRQLGQVIIRAWQKGCKFDGWGEHFRYDLWMETFAEMDIHPAFYANRKMGLDEILPWELIDIGVSTEFLKKEYQKALEAEITPNCRQKCSGCGAASFGGGVCFE